MYHVFICYPRTYLAQVSPLHDALELALRNIYRRDAEVFQDTSDLEAVNKWEGDVNTALEHARVMIVVVVPTILESAQCRREMLHFINTPGKHLVPLTCETVPRLRQLAESVDKHPEGSEAHQIAVCARALRSWQEFDFSKIIYQKPNETEYKVAVAELARMIRNKLDQEDHAADRAATREFTVQEATTVNGGTGGASASGEGQAAGGTDAPTGDIPGARDTVGESQAGTPSTGGGMVRRILLGGVLLAALVAIGVGVWIWRTPTPEPELDRTRAQALLSRVLTSAAGEADHLTFNSQTGALRVTAPPVGRVSTRIALQPGIEPILRAGFVPGFADASTDGDACFTLNGDPLLLTGSILDNGAFATVRLRLYENAEPQNQKVCIPTDSTWKLIEQRNAVVNSGAILAAPSDDAREIRTLRRGQQITGPFWIHSDVPGWVRLEYRGSFAYFRRDVIEEFR